MLPTIHHGALPLIISGPDEVEADDGELDSLRLTVLLDTATDPWRTAAASAGYARKTKLTGYHSMWVRTLGKTQTTDITTEVAVDAIGLIATGEKRRRTLGVAGSETSVGPTERIIIVTEEQTGEDPETSTDGVAVKRRVPKLDSLGEVVLIDIVTPSGTAKRWLIKTPFLTVTDTYIVAGAAPSTTIIGTAQTPPTAPTAPTNPWAGYTGTLRGIHPTGWVLDDRNVTQLFVDGADGLYQVTDTYGYYYAAIPD